MSEKEKKLIENVIRKTAEVDDRAAEAVQAFASGLASGIEIGRAQERAAQMPEKQETEATPGREG